MVQIQKMKCKGPCKGIQPPAAEDKRVGRNSTDLPAVNIAPIFFLPLMKARAFWKMKKKRAWLHALKPSCDAVLGGPPPRERAPRGMLMLGRKPPIVSRIA